MEMPVPCKNCNEIVELDSTRQSPLTKDLVCHECFTIDDKVNDLVEEAKNIHYDLDNYAEHMKGDRRGWKRNLKDLKQKINDLGFDANELVL